MRGSLESCWRLRDDASCDLLKESRIASRGTLGGVQAATVYIVSGFLSLNTNGVRLDRRK